MRLRGASGACSTFGNQMPLSGTPNFDIISVEIWELSIERYGAHTSTQTHAFGESLALAAILSGQIRTFASPIVERSFRTNVLEALCKEACSHQIFGTN